MDRKFVLWMTLLVLVLPVPLPAGQLNWMGHWKGEDKRELLVHEVKKQYEFLHPEMTVNLRFDVDIEGEGEYYKMKVAHKIVEMIRTGRIEWDIVFCDIPVYNHVADLLNDPLWGRKHLVDFATVPGFLASQKDFIVNTPYYRERMGGIFAGPHIEGIVFCLWTTRQVAEKTGIAVKERGMTSDDFLAYARALAAYNKEHGTFIPFLHLSSFNRIEALFEYLFKSQFSDPEFVIQEKYDQRKAEAFLATLKIFEQLSHYQPVINADWRTHDWRDCERDFLAGDSLFLPGGTYMYSHFRGVSPQAFQNGIPVELPYVKQPNGLVGHFVNAFAVMKRSPNRQAAIDLSMMWAEPEIAEKWVEYTRNPTGIRGNFQEPVMGRVAGDVYGDFLYDMELQYSTLPMRNFRAPTYVFGKGIPIGEEKFRNDLVLILEGKLNAGDYYQALVRQIRQ